MPRDIKLDCYHFNLSKIRTDTDYNFGHFYDEFSSDEEEISMESKYRKFLIDLTNYFASEYRINKQETKGITIRADDDYLVDPESNLISGFIRGGGTGIGITIQERNDTTLGDDFDGSKIRAIPHYFALWTPTDSNKCVLIVQSYTGESLSGMFLDNFEKYLKTKRIRLGEKIKFLPQEMVDDFRNNAKVRSVTLKSSRFSRPMRNDLNPILIEEDNLTVELTIKGFKQDTTWNRLQNWLNQREGQLLGIELDNLNLDQPIDRIVEYNYKGSNLKGKLSMDFQIVPSLSITDDIELNESQHPKFESIHEYCKVFMKDLMREIGYDSDD